MSNLTAEVRARGRLVTTVSTGMAEWLRANGQGDLLDQMLAASKTYQATGSPLARLTKVEFSRRFDKQSAIMDRYRAEAARRNGTSA